jgi:DtxR family Mn-dependent transcriptional regulator
MEAMLPSQTVENYLKTIHLAQMAQTDRALVPMGQLASALGVVPGTATTMMKALAESGLVHYEPYMGVRLTTAGEKLASLVLRRHRLIELFLVKVMGMSWAEVHDEAERLEHAVSEVLVERMATALGNPRFDPHGDPIPDQNGAMDELVYTPLAEIPDGETAEIRRVATSQAERLRYLKHSGLTPGTRVTVTGHQPFRGPITVTTEGHEQIIGHELAEQVLCVRPEPR